MLWKKQKCLPLMVVLMLGCLALCLETVRKGNLVQAGKLIIGSSSNTSKNKDGIGQVVYNEYAQDPQGYQSELMGGSQLANLMLRSWSPSVRCDNESMTLRMQGSRLPVFLVETSKVDPVPLLRIPSHCGLSVRRARRDVSLVAKYDGCNVVQQGDAYILPLYVLGVVVTMVCPADRPLTMVSCSSSAMVVSLGMSPDAVRLKVNGVWEPVYQASTTCGFMAEVAGSGLTLTAPYTSTCWRFEDTARHLSVQYMDRELTLSCPAVQHFPPTSPPQHDYMGYSFYGYGMPRYVPHGQPETFSNPPMTTASTTTAKTHTTKATTVAHNGVKQPLWYPWLSGRYNAYALPWYVHPGQPGTLLNPTTTTASTTSVKTQTTVIAHDSANQPFLNSWLPGRYNPYAIPRYVHHGQPGTLSNAPTTTPLTMTKTAANRVAPTVTNQLWYPWLQGMCKSSGYGIPWYFHQEQPAAPMGAHAATTTTTSAPIGAYPPLLYPWLPGIKNHYTHVGSNGVPVSGSAVKHQYSVPWMNALQVPSGLGSKSNAKLFSG